VPEWYINQQKPINNTDRRIYAGMLEWTDNGAPAAGFNSQAMSNYPLRGQKTQLWKGGIRGMLNIDFSSYVVWYVIIL